MESVASREEIVLSLHTLEVAIWREAQIFFKNPKLRLKDLREWRTCEIKPQEGEVTAELPILRVFVTVPASTDKRATV